MPSFYSSPGIVNFSNPRPLTGTVNGSNKVFSLPSPVPTSFLIVVAGLHQQPGTDFSQAGAQITFTSAPVVTPVAYSP